MDQEGNEASKKKGGNEDQQDNSDQQEAQNENEAQIEDDQSWNQCMVQYESDDDSLNSDPSSVQGRTEDMEVRPASIPPPPIPHMEVSNSHVPLLGRLTIPPEPAVQDSANQESTPSLMGFTSRPLPVPGRIEPAPLQEGAVSSGVLVQTDSAPQTDSSAQTGFPLPDPMTPSVNMSRDASADIVSEEESRSTFEVTTNRDTSVAETITESMEDPLAAFSSPFVPPIPARPRSRPGSATRPQSNVTETPQPPTAPQQQDISSAENSSTTREFLLNLQKGIGPDLRNSFSAVGRNPMAVGTNQPPMGVNSVRTDPNPLGVTGANIGQMTALNRNQSPPAPAVQAASQSETPPDGVRRRRSFLQRLFSRKKRDGD